MCQGPEPCCWSVLLPCAMGRWGWPDWPLITPCFVFVSEHCTLPHHSHLPFLQGKKLRKQREWWRGEQECELLGKGEVKHRCWSQFYRWWHLVCCLWPVAQGSSWSAAWERALQWEQGKHAQPWEDCVSLWAIHQHKETKTPGSSSQAVTAPPVCAWPRALAEEDACLFIRHTIGIWQIFNSKVGACELWLGQGVGTGWL